MAWSLKRGIAYIRTCVRVVGSMMYMGNFKLGGDGTEGMNGFLCHIFRAWMGGRRRHYVGAAL